MRQPRNDEQVRCPNASSSKKWKPEKCWDSYSPKGEKIVYGILGKHRHRGHAKECEQSGLPVLVEREKKS